jgi:hypothetical protein
MTAKETISAYDSLTERAVGICSTSYVMHEPFSRLSIEGDEAVLSWPESRSEYDCCVIETEKVRFPAYLLDATEEEIDAWQAEQRRLADVAHQEWLRNSADQERQRELAMLASLQRKYGAR